MRWDTTGTIPDSQDVFALIITSDRDAMAASGAQLLRTIGELASHVTPHASAEAKHYITGLYEMAYILFRHLEHLPESVQERLLDVLFSSWANVLDATLGAPQHIQDDSLRPIVGVIGISAS